MKAPSPVLQALARRYRRRQAGRTGEASRDVIFKISELLEAANATEGDAHELAESQLREAEAAGVLSLIPLHRRDPSSLYQVRFSAANEAKLYDLLNDISPTQVRADLAGQFAEAALANVPDRWRENWQAWCGRKREAAIAGRTVEPFDRYPTEENAELLRLLSTLLAWEGESLVRFVSCRLCQDSKELELLAPVEEEGRHGGKLRGKLGRWLEEITTGEICTLNDLGILPNPRFALVHGPIRLHLGGVWLELGALAGAFRIALKDIQRVDQIETAATRCLTVENETTFHELAKLQSGELLVQTSFPGSGTLEFLKLLPKTLEFWHFGDSDKAGFEILRDLREKSGRDFHPLHMEEGRKNFEQESLGWPSPRWPFYEPGKMKSET